ncbi:5,10-methylenetetrahydrofolate reductase [Desulfurococcaceae archaeon MEX13E-LK6-19]|nr:5,10-methylenetetrahydrofolate reductase [Desulfurococcaceae archaeon MEX13E-LK6-19]
MKILVELAPRKEIGELETILTSVKEYVDCFDIPESPLGIPAPNSIATGIYVKNVTGKCVISHIRLYDVNRTALLSLAYAAQLYGIDGIVLTHGDIPRSGVIVRDITTIDAIKLLEKEVPKLKIGAIISLRYPFEDIVKRIDSGADFYLVLRLSKESIEKYMKVLDAAEKQGVELYPYIIVSTEKNKKILEKIKQPSIPLNELQGFLSEYRDLLHGVVFSSPLDLDGLIKSLEIAYETKLVSRKALQQQQCFQASL